MHRLHHPLALSALALASLGFAQDLAKVQTGLDSAKSRCVSAHIQARIEIERDYDIPTGFTRSPAYDQYVWQFDRIRFAYLGNRRSSSWDGQEGQVRWTPRNAGLDGSFELLGIAIGSRLDPIHSAYLIWWPDPSHPTGPLRPTYLADVVRDSAPEVSTHEHWVHLEWPAAGCVVDLDPDRDWLIREAQYRVTDRAVQNAASRPKTGDGGLAIAAVQTSKVENDDFVRFANLWIPTSIRETQTLPNGRQGHSIAKVSALSGTVENRFWELFHPGDVVSRGGPPLTIGADGLPQPPSGGSNSAAVIIAALGVGTAALAATWILRMRRTSHR